MSTKLTGSRLVAWVGVAAVAAALAFASGRSLIDASRPLTRTAIGNALLASGRALEAALVHEDPMHAGVAWFRAGRYERAADAFALTDAVTARYNEAVAMAHLKRIDVATRLLNSVLAEDPNHEDARHNLAVLQAIDRAGEHDDAQPGAQRQHDAVQQKHDGGPDSQMTAANEPIAPQDEPDPGEDRSTTRPKQPDDVASLGGAGRGESDAKPRIEGDTGEGSSPATKPEDPASGDAQNLDAEGMQQTDAAAESQIADNIRTRRLVDDPALVLQARLAAAARARALAAR